MDVIDLVMQNASTAILAFVSGLSLVLWWWSQRPKNVPPGPMGLPYIGSMIPLVKGLSTGTFVNFLMELHKNYGPIVSLKAGVQRMIFINDGELVANLYQRDEFAVRPVESFPAMRRLVNGEKKGLFMNNGESNKEMRRFALLSLRDFGVGKKSLDEMIQTEATILCQHLEDLANTKRGIMTDLKIKMQYATANVIHHVIFGYRQEYEDPKWKRLVKLLYDFFDINALGLPENFIPILQRFPAVNQMISRNMSEKFFSVNASLVDYIESQIEEHRSTYVDGEIRDFIDLYIKYETEEKEFYTKSNIFTMILDLFRAGSDTAATTLSWAVLHMVKNPDMQRQLREEIDEMVGDRQFDRKDKDNLPRTRAFINEIHRYVSVAIMAPPHTVDRPVDVKGYTLVPGDVIFASLFAMHHDKEYWGDPDKFRIDRWIDEKGELIKHEGHFYPFSVGKRACPGKQFANIEVMLILVQFLQNFTFEEAEGYSDLSEEQTAGLIRAPKSFHFKVNKRQ